MVEASKPVQRSRRPSRAQPRQLSRDEVLDAALRLVDTHGLEALTMRALAQDLGVFPTALYWHAGTKAQLVAAVSARVFDEVILPNEHELGWEDWLAEVARRWRAAMHRHPNLAPVIGSQLVVSTTALPFVERMVGVLERAGFAGDDLVDAYNGMTGFVVGWVTMELSSEPSDADEGWKGAYAEQLNALSQNSYPVLTRNMSLLENNAFMTRYDSGRARPMDRSFAFALDTFLRGLRR